MRSVLLPLSWIYGVVVAARNMAFDRGLLRVRNTGVPVISVGNITAGGMGKTPCVAVLLEIALRNGCRPAVVSRGYGRSTRGLVVVADGTGSVVSSRRGGDEAVMLAHRFPNVIVVVAERRIDAARKAVELGADCLIADDAFQHRQLARDVNIVMTGDELAAARNPLIPAGRGREPLSALRRASVIVCTADDEESARRNAERVSGAELFFADISATDIVDPFSSAAHLLEELRGCPVVAFSGIAHPERFLGALRAAGASIVETRTFPDHHWFTEHELRAAQAAATANHATLVTTEKDWARLANCGDSAVDFGGSGVRILRVALRFRRDAAGFEAKVWRTVNAER